MNRCRKIVRIVLIAFSCLLFSIKLFAQLTIGSVDPGPYTPGSTIAVTFSIGAASCISQENVFNLRLSDATGNFAPGTIIGSYAGFYSTYVNGIIPAGTPDGTGYKVRVESTTPILTTSDSAPFEIKAGTSVEAKLTSTYLKAGNTETFGTCTSTPNKQFLIKNESTATSTVTATITDELGGGTTLLNFPTPIQTFTAQLSHYTVFTKALMPDGTVATKAYLIVNNTVVTAFSTAGNNIVCLPLGSLEFTVITSGPGGIQNNFPGDTYMITWGDGTSTEYTFCDIKNSGGIVKHFYTKSSCGSVSTTSSGTVYNAFDVSIKVRNDFCPSLGTPISSYAKVVVKPINSFTPVPTGCTNKTITFINTSIQGEDPNTNTPGCTPNDVTYNWFVDGVPWEVNMPLSYNFVHTFTTNGEHTVRLESSNPGACNADPVEEKICIQDPPKPKFALSNKTICAPGTIKVTDLSIVDSTCNVPNIYSWTVTPAVGYANGTTASDKEPEFNFAVGGLYTVVLNITSASCGLISTLPDTVVVNETPTVTLSKDTALCNLATYDFSNVTLGPTKTIFTGTYFDLPPTYLWTVTGGAYSFVNGSNQNSKYPSIKFDDYTVYTISATQTNGCGTDTKIQTISFSTAPVVKAGPDQPICYNDPSFTLAGSVIGTFTSVSWLGGSGTFFPSRDDLNAIYTPTAIEKAAGTVTLKLRAITALPSPCNQIDDIIILTIKPDISLTSAPTKSICTGTDVAYTPTNNVLGTNFTWTAISSANAGGFATSGSGPISDILTNSDPLNNATVTYTITPHHNGCDGTPFDFIVTIMPRAQVTFTAPTASICNKTSSAITLIPNLAGTKFIYTSVVIAGSLTGNTDNSVASTNTIIGDVLTNTGLVEAIVKYTVTPSSASGCDGTPVDIIIKVSPSASIASAGIDDEVCDATTYKLNGNNPSVGIGKWTVVSAPNAISFVNTQYDALVSGLMPGNSYEFKWTITDVNGCDSTSKNVIITVNKSSEGGTTSGATTVCAGNSNGTITLAGQLGNILGWESSPDGSNWTSIAGSAGQTSVAYSNLNATTYYHAIIKNGVCAQAYSTETIITVNQGAVAASVGIDQILCGGNSTTLTGNDPLTNIGLWTLTSGQTGVNIVAPGLFNSSVTGLVPGQTYTFKWTISGLAPCPATSADLKVQIDLPTLGGTTSGADTVCAGNSNGTITLAGQVGNILGWESSPDGSNWTSIAGSAGQTSVAYTNLNATTYYHAIIKNGVCAQVYSTETIITVNQGAVAASVGIDQILCGGNSTTLTGNDPLTNIGLWTLTSGQTGVNIVAPGLYNTSVTGLVPGQTYTFKWTISGLAPCPATSADLKVQIDLPTLGGTTSGADTVCAGNSNGTITLAGQVGNILGWESSPDGSNWTSIAGSAGQTSVAYTNLNATTYYHAIIKNGVCAQAYSTETIITVNQGAVAASVGIDQILCGGNSTTLTGNDPLTNIGLWTLTSGQTGVNIVAPGLFNSNVTGLVPGQTYTFKWTISGLAPCPATSADLKVQIDLPSVGGTTAGDVDFCSPVNTGSIGLSGQTGQIVRWESSIDGLNWATINSTANPYAYSNIATNTQFRAIVLNGVCAEAISTATTITVNPITVVAKVDPDQNICSGNSVTLVGNDPAPNLGTWTLVSGQTGVNISTPTSSTTTATGLIPGQNYTFRWTITGFTSCSPTFAETAVNYYPTVVNTISASAIPVCSGQNINITGNTPTGGTGVYTFQWQSSTDGINFADISIETNKDLSLTVLSTLYYRRLVNSAICASYSNIIQITALPPIANNIITANQAICVGNTPVPLIGSLPTGGDGNYSYQWQSSFDGAIWVNMNLETNQNLILPVPTKTILYRRIVKSATCTGAFENISNEVTVTLNPHAKAEFTYAIDKTCAPFILNATNIKAVPYSDRNATYTWYADNIAIGTGTTFPGYTITNDNQVVDIKLVVTSSLNCNSDTMSHNFSTPQKIIASFTQSTTGGCSPSPVTFTNTSTSLTDATFTWNFGNGVISNLATPPTIIFLSRTDGRDTTYNVKLKSVTACDTTTATSTVFVPGQPISVFSPDKTIACSGSNIVFTNFSPGSTNTYYYDFDDRSPILNDNNNTVNHTFNTLVVKDYKVKLTTKNACGESSTTYIIRIFPNNITTSFFANGNEKEGCAPLTVNFNNNTQGASSYDYDFGGDGSKTTFVGGSEVVSHTFNKPGTYTVKLYAKNGCFSAEATETIIVYPQADVSFSADKTIGCDGNIIKFKNTSTDAVSYVWDFGDGSPTSDQFEPTHTYSGSGLSYTVSLTAVNSLGCPKTTTLNNYINIAKPPKADFIVDPGNETTLPNYTFRFVDTSIDATAGSWEWSFGDGSTSKQQNPAHTYNDVGKYTVTLKVVNANGCPDITNQEVRITGIPSYLNIPNSFMPGSARNELRTFSAKGTGIQEWKMTVFNKWGQILWETIKLDQTAPAEGWDGTFNGVEQPQGVYYWKIDVKFLNGGLWKGMTYDSSAPKKTGLIYLIR